MTEPLCPTCERSKDDPANLGLRCGTANGRLVPCPHPFHSDKVTLRYRGRAPFSHDPDLDDLMIEEDEG